MKKKIKITSLVLSILIISTVFFSCSKRQSVAQSYNEDIFYEVFVRAFNDSNGDGIGDLKGVTKKLDYLKELGVSGIWLMPIQESPSYHGYDVSNYYKINKDYGTMEDFKELIKEAHKKNIKVVMDLVINHTSTEHPWFSEAIKDSKSKYRDYYIWANKDTDVTESSPMGTMPWANKNGQSYYAIFWEGMPDLNFDNIKVRNELKKIAKFYLDMGVDGFRLDAAKWIYNDDNKNLEWWKEFDKYVKGINKDTILVGEVWDEVNKTSPYMNSLDSCFDFSTADTIVKSISSNAFDSIATKIKINYDSYVRENKKYKCSTFLTNHDMNRVMSEVKDKNKAKQAAAILLTLPGTPYIYYGEEIGMEGTKPDEKIREPFIWDKKNNTSWEESTNDAKKVSVKVQEKDKSSILNTYKDLIKLRNNNEILKNGDFEDLDVENNVTAYKRTFENKSIYVFINGEDKNIKEKVPFNKGKVLYSSNKERNKKIKSSKGNISIFKEEIIIIESKNN